MKVKTYRDLEVWQEAMSLAVDLHKTFLKNRDFVFRDQIARASLSVSNNIAEGFDRSSTKDFLRFLFIAKSSNSETESMLFFASEVGYLSADDSEIFGQRCLRIRKMLWGLIKSLQKKIN